ncbi:hypothetical protein D3C87_1777270 [compost metagenome]
MLARGGQLGLLDHLGEIHVAEVLRHHDVVAVADLLRVQAGGGQVRDELRGFDGDGFAHDALTSLSPVERGGLLDTSRSSSEC